MRPYIICYMMTSIDGRIDCNMTAQLKGVDDYYNVLKELDIPSTVSGKVTAETELALKGKFKADTYIPYDKEAFYKGQEGRGYEIILDSKGTLLWNKETSSEKPHLILMSEKASVEYTEYLKKQNISFIICGKEHVDIRKASEVLFKEFGVRRMGLVGGPTMNSAFLNADLTDEIVLLIGPGVDGRTEMPSVFEGRTSAKPLALELKDVRRMNSGAVVLDYKVN